MTLRRVHVMLLASQLLLASLVFGQSYKVETAAAPAAGQLPGPLQDALQPDGAKVVSDQGATLLDLGAQSAAGQFQPDDLFRRTVRRANGGRICGSRAIHLARGRTSAAKPLSPGFIPCAMP